MKKGDQVYLGYLMDIDYDRETVTFVLTRGELLNIRPLKWVRQKKGRKIK
jgi:hypothetical protein